MQLSIVIPAHNEEFVIAETVKSLDKCLNGEIPGKYDILSSQIIVLIILKVSWKNYQYNMTM